MFKLKLVHKSDNGEYIEHESHHPTLDEATEEANDIAFLRLALALRHGNTLHPSEKKAAYTISTPLTVIPQSSTLSESSGQYKNRKQRRAEAAITRSKRKGVKR